MGSQKPEGHRFQAANGYWYEKRNGKHRLLHHLIAEEQIGAPIDTRIHRVSFKDGNRENLDPDNIVVTQKSKGKQQRIDAIKKKIALLQEELEELESR